MKLLDGDKLKKHLDYLIEKDSQFAKMCDGYDDFNRQRKFCFETDILAYQLCQNIMDYYVVSDSHPVVHGEWEIFYQDGKPKLKCTNCHSLFDIRTNDKHICIYPKFCEECGADMRNCIQNSQELIYKKACEVDVETSIKVQKSCKQWCDNVKAVDEQLQVVKEGTMRDNEKETDFGIKRYGEGFCAGIGLAQQYIRNAVYEHKNENEDV